jgi:hypothetical protein
MRTGTAWAYTCPGVQRTVCRCALPSSQLQIRYGRAPPEVSVPPHFTDQQLTRIWAYADWSLTSLFDRTIDRACPVAASSRVVVTLPTGVPYSIRPEPSSTGNGRGIFDLVQRAFPPFPKFPRSIFLTQPLAESLPLDVGMHWLEPFQHGSASFLLYHVIAIQTNPPQRRFPLRRPRFLCAACCTAPLRTMARLLFRSQTPVQRPCA